MANQVELKQYILFALNRLPAENAHHQFELMCKDLAKENIMENIIPATGPVARIGDQGRDFLSFKTYLDDNLEENSNFLGETSSGNPVVFTCSIQQDVTGKIKSDVDKIIDYGLPVESVYFFSREDVKIGKRNELKKWAYDTHQINVEILDGNAISDILATRKNHWIAKQYLKIPTSLFPSNQNFQNIQAFFNRIATMIERLHKHKFNTSYKILERIIRDFDASELKHFLGMSISQTKRGFENKIEFLNGKYILHVNMYVEQIQFGLYKDQTLIDLSSPVDILLFYKDLQDHIKLNNGYTLELPKDLIEKEKEIVEIHESFREITDLVIQLYKTESKSSAFFARKILNSEKMSEFFGVYIRNPTRSDGNLADEYFYFLNGKYFIIPNSRTLRIRNQQGHYEDLLSKESPSEEILKVLKEFFEELIDYTNEKYNLVNLSISVRDISNLLSSINNGQEEIKKERELETVDYELLENHIIRLSGTKFSKEDPLLNRVRIELGKISRNRTIERNHKSTIRNMINFAKEGLLKKEGDKIEIYLDVLYLLTFTSESMDLIKEICFKNLESLYEEGNRWYDLLRILYACGYFGDLNSAFIKAIEEKIPKFLTYLKDQFCLLIYNEEIKGTLKNERFDTINQLYDKLKELKPDTSDVDKTLNEKIKELIQKYENLV